MIGSKNSQETVNKVIKENLCVFCGACVGTCPYFISFNGRIIVRDVCAMTQGRCSSFCPRISLDLEKLNQAVYQRPYSWQRIGAAKTVLMARSTDKGIKARAQDAGTVTTLLCFAKEEGFIDSAVLTHFEDKASPKGMAASTRDEILACAGSSYVATPILETFNRVVRNPEHEKVGVVGTPCHTLALAKMKTAETDGENPSNKLKLVIGLFCTWSLSCSDFGHFIEQEISDPVVKYDIPPHPANVLRVYTKKNRVDIPLDKILPFVRPACRFCHDLTSEFADISVGSGRGEVSDWNTVIVRTPIGLEIMEGAERKGLIETREMPKENLSRLETASYNKKKKALKNIIQKTGHKDDLLYLNVQTEAVEKLLEE